MGVGEFNAAERFEIEEAIREAEQASRFEFSLFVGRSGADSRAFATQLHNKLVAPSHSVLIMVDPAARALEIVTGGTVRRSLSDQEVDLAALQMQSAFAQGDLVGGLRRGIQMLGEHAAQPPSLHTDRS